MTLKTDVNYANKYVDFNTRFLESPYDEFEPFKKLKRK